MEIKKISVNIVTVVAICLFLITTTIGVIKYYVGLEKRITLAEMNIAKKAEISEVEKMNIKLANIETILLELKKDIKEMK